MLVITGTAGYKVGEKKSVNEYASLDAEDESLARWKASLGIGATATTAVDPNAPRVSMTTEEGFSLHRTKISYADDLA